VSVKFAPWAGATQCTGSATPGARALMAWILANVKDATNLGIYSCRNVRGGSTTSCHGEGRALDVGMPMARGKGSAAGEMLVALLLEAGPANLGIQTVIYNRRIYSAKTPGGRPYTGVNPHYDHLHIELTRAAGAKLNLATVRAVLGGKPKPEVVEVVSTDDGKKPTLDLRDVAAAFRADPERPQGNGLHPGDVRVVELALKAEGLLEAEYATDGYAGTKTVAAYAAWQKKCGYKGKAADGIPGEESLKRLGAEHGFRVVS
jgi:hypothetical protein